MFSERAAQKRDRWRDSAQVYVHVPPARARLGEQAFLGAIIGAVLARWSRAGDRALARVGEAWPLGVERLGRGDRLAALGEDAGDGVADDDVGQRDRAVGQAEARDGAVAAGGEEVA